ncbi:MAG: hypothetical protein GXX83_06085 [Gaiellales bacterium]|nr:hypothetical protein [Gaiellales bacterium]
MSADSLRALATLALLHELADDAWRAAVERGRAQRPQAPGAGADTFLDGLAALVAEERDRLRREWAEGDVSAREPDALAREMAELRFEVAEMRGRLEAVEQLLDGLRAGVERLVASREGTGRCG